MSKKQDIIKSLAAMFISGIALANPTLPVGTWVNITPSQINPANSPCTDIRFDPSNHSILWAVYGNADGLYKSTDGGSSWARTGNLPTPIALGRIRIDPHNSNHLYFAGGLGAGCNGFWITTDGGTTWAIPPAFSAGVSNWTFDLYNMEVDPTDFNHAIVTSHQPWAAFGEDAGVLETKDGGATFIAHNPPSGMDHGQGIAFLCDPAKGIGNGNCWLVGGGYTTGLFRTTDGGTNWTNVNPNFQDNHGGYQSTYSSSGYVYIGGMGGIYRSTDNGTTWKESTSGVPYGWYGTVVSDGNNLYTCQGFVGVPSNSPFLVSKEGGTNEGLAWTNYSTQIIPNGPWRMEFDPTSRIIYNATWSSGAWALKTDNQVTAASSSSRAAPASHPALHRKLAVVKNRMVVSAAAPRGETARYRINGMAVK